MKNQFKNVLIPIGIIATSFYFSSCNKENTSPPDTIALESHMQVLQEVGIILRLVLEMLLLQLLMKARIKTEPTPMCSSRRPTCMENLILNGVQHGGNGEWNIRLPAIRLLMMPAL